MAGSIYDRMMGTPHYDSNAGTSALNAAANAFQGMASTFNTMRQSIIDEEQKNLQREMEKQHHQEEMDYKDRSLAQDYKQHTERLDFERLKHADEQSMEQKKLDMQWRIANLRSSGGGGGGGGRGRGGNGEGASIARGHSIISMGAGLGQMPSQSTNQNKAANSSPKADSTSDSLNSKLSDISIKSPTDAALDDAFESLGGSNKSFKLDSFLEDRASKLEGGELNHGQTLSLYPTIKREETPKESAPAPLDLRAYARTGLGQSILRSQAGLNAEDPFKASVNPEYQETNRSAFTSPLLDVSKARVDMPQEWRNDDSIGSLGASAEREGIDINPAIERNTPSSISYEVAGPSSLSAIKQAVPQANAVNTISTMYENPSVDFATPRANQLIQASADRADLLNRNLAQRNAPDIQEERDEQTRRDWFSKLRGTPTGFDFSFTPTDFNSDYAAFTKKSTEDKIDAVLDYKLKNDSIYQKALSESYTGARHSGMYDAASIQPALKAKETMLARREELRKEAETEVDTYFGEKKTVQPTRFKNPEEEEKFKEDVRATDASAYSGSTVIPEGNSNVPLPYKSGAINDEERSNYTGTNVVMDNSQAVELYKKGSTVHQELKDIMTDYSEIKGNKSTGYYEKLKPKEFATGLADYVANVWATQSIQERRNTFDTLVASARVARMYGDLQSARIYHAAAIGLRQTFSPTFKAGDQNYRKRLRADVGEAMGYGTYFYEDRTKAQEAIDKDFAVQSGKVGLIVPGNLGEEDVKKFTKGKFENFEPVMQEQVVNDFNDDAAFSVPRNYIYDHRNSKGQIDLKYRQVAATAHAKAFGKVLAQYYNEKYWTRGKVTEDGGYQQFIRDLEDEKTEIGRYYRKNFNLIADRLMKGRKQ